MAKKEQPSQTGGFDSPTLAQLMAGTTTGDNPNAVSPQQALAAGKAPSVPTTTGTGVKGSNFSEFGSDLAATMPVAPSTQQDINSMLDPYIKEMSNLGTEYGQELEYLKPYLNYGDQTFQGLQAQSKANESPTGDKGLAAAINQSASALENQTPPGFGSATQAAKQFEQTVPYSNVLQDVLAAGKNQILGYSTTPNLTNINTSQWGDAMKAVLPYLEQSIGYTASGVPNPTTAGITAGTLPGGYNPTNNPNAPSTTPAGTGSTGLGTGSTLYG